MKSNPRQNLTFYYLADVKTIALSFLLGFYITQSQSHENSPRGNSHPENSHPSNFPLENFPPGKFRPRKFPPGIFPPIFSNILFFSLLLPLSLILVKRLYFCLLKMLKLDLMRCIKKICSLPATQEMFWT